MKPRLAHLLFELAQHGITSVSAVLVLRNEADRYVSGLVQRVQSMTTRPWQKMGDVPADELVQPIDRFIAALRAAQVDVVTIPYTDPDDARPLLDRFAGTALKIDTSTDWVPLADKVNVSLGVVGCVCGKTIAGLIETTYADDASAIQRACGWSKKQLRGAYSDIMQGEADAPFNLAGPERIKLIQDIQAPSLRALANELTAAQLEVLGRTKWLGVPKSPQSADELDPREQLLFTSILHRFVERVRAHSKTFDAVGERAVSAIQHFASTHTTVGATA